MNILFSNYWVLFASIWMFANGVLHDVFVLARHKGPYTRDLLQLLMDGHVLIFSGLGLALGFLILQAKVNYGSWLVLIMAVSMLVYCLMIFPFLKSFVTTFISIIVLAVAVRCIMESGPLFPN